MSLDAYKPGRGVSSFKAATGKARLGDAWTDAQNPIRKIFGGDRLDLWSLRKPVPSSCRRTSDRPKRSGAPVDRFVLAKLDAAGSRALARGRPPYAHSPPQLRPDRACHRRPRTMKSLPGGPAGPTPTNGFVDRLLASPRYGERWGRAWLDVVRYADSNGFERDEFRPNMWRYRDYVIRSLNTRQALRPLRDRATGRRRTRLPARSGSAEDADRIAATGYLRLGTFDSTTSLFAEDKKGRDELMGDLANTTGSAFLGLTMSCCQCHDHKYDPLSQADHFRLACILRGRQAEGRPGRQACPRNARRSRGTTQTPTVGSAMAEASPESPGRSRPVPGSRCREEGRASRARSASSSTFLATKRDAATKETLKPFRGGARKSRTRRSSPPSPSQVRKQAEGARRRDRGDQEVEDDPRPRRRVMTDAGRSAPPTNRSFFQGDFTQPRDAVEPGYPSALEPNPAVIEPPATESTGRRLALARWITSRDNPWTARVIVNRIWAGIFWSRPGRHAQ